MEYDPVAPLALPLGPRSAGMRAQLAAEVPFAFVCLLFVLCSFLVLSDFLYFLCLQRSTCVRVLDIVHLISCDLFAIIFLLCVTSLTVFLLLILFPVCSRFWRIRWTSKHWRRSRPATCSCYRCPPISSKFSILSTARCLLPCSCHVHSSVKSVCFAS